MAAASAENAADSHEVIRVRGARENNLDGVDVDVPKRRLTVFTGVSGSGKSSLVFGTIAAESRRLINETYPTFVQQFIAQIARPEVDALENISPAIIVDQERMGANARSTVGTATDVHAMLRVLFSRIGEPFVGSPQAFSFNVPSVSGGGGDHGRGRGRRGPSGTTALPGDGRDVSRLRGPRRGQRHRHRRAGRPVEVAQRRGHPGSGLQRRRLDGARIQRIGAARSRQARGRLHGCRTRGLSSTESRPRSRSRAST